MSVSLRDPRHGAVEERPDGDDGVGNHVVHPRVGVRAARHVAQLLHAPKVQITYKCFCLKYFLPPNLHQILSTLY